MKQCLKCYKTYADDSLNFCLEDGEPLVGSVPSEFSGSSSSSTDDSPPTMVMDQARQTDPINWPSAPPAPSWQPQGMQQQFASPAFVAKRDQTIPTIALILGILSLPLICCYGGFWLGLPAAVLGFIGIRNADKDTSRFGGRGLAIGGMVLGAVSFLASLVVAIAAIIANS